ncbi:MAG TPA: geranylgeranyl reductase family protein [Holophagaceae bacterium]|nr:geranylgeranyl reductase family protein [Holophagaceae bacterium]
MTLYDVAIVGAGPAGSVCAWSLARQGKSVLLLDKAPFPRVKPCGGGVSPQVGRWLPFDFSPAISLRPSKIRFTWKAHEDAVELDLGQDLLWMVRREIFDQLLVDHAVNEGAVFEADCALRGLVREAEAWRLDTSKGAHRARVVVAADGALGTTTKLLGLKPASRALAGAIEAESPVPPSDPSVVHLDFGTVKAGYLWNFPKADGQSCGIGVFRGKPEGSLDERLEGYLQGFDLNLSGCHRMAHPILLWDGDRALHTEHALVIGEAAGVVDPLTAEGIRPAIWSGLKAAETLVAAGPHGSLAGYTHVMAETLGADMAWARRLARAFYATPELAWRVVVKHPRGPRVMAQVLMGEASYRDAAARALSKLTFGLA